MRAECGPAGDVGRSPTPDAALFFADRTLALDHAAGDVYLLALHRPDGESTGPAAIPPPGAVGCALAFAGGGHPGNRGESEGVSE